MDAQRLLGPGGQLEGLEAGGREPGEAGEGAVKLQVMWKSQDVATLDIKPNEVPLLEATEVPDGDEERN